MLGLRRDPLATIAALRHKYGQAVHFRVGPRRIFFFFEPEAVREVLVTRHASFHKGLGLQRAKIFFGDGLLTSEGALHRRQRRLVNPAFHHERLHAYARAMSESTLRLAEGWRDGAEVDMAGEMMRLTLEIVARTLFGSDVSRDVATISHSMEVMMANVNRLIAPFAEVLNRLPLPSTLRIRRAIQALDEVILRLIRERLDDPEDRGDLLSMLLLARDEETGMSAQLVRDEAMTIFLAGHETTANALAWTWHLLATHPEVEAALHAELEQVLGDRAPEFADVRRLETTERILTEAMRLYPPAWIIARMAMEPVEVGGYVLPPGSIAATPQYIVHRSPEYFPEPERFDPGRWTPAFKAALPRYAYFPFGGGARQCAGESFAWMEATLCLATLAQRWRARSVPGLQVEPYASITLRPRNGLRMILERR